MKSTKREAEKQCELLSGLPSKASNFCFINEEILAGFRRTETTHVNPRARAHTHTQSEKERFSQHPNFNLPPSPLKSQLLSEGNQMRLQRMESAERETSCGGWTPLLHPTPRNRLHECRSQNTGTRPTVASDWTC